MNFFSLFPEFAIPAECLLNATPLDIVTFGISGKSTLSLAIGWDMSYAEEDRGQNPET